VELCISVNVGKFKNVDDVNGAIMSGKRAEMSCRIFTEKDDFPRDSLDVGGNSRHRALVENVEGSG
jgi:hypothetical protein